MKYSIEATDTGYTLAAEFKVARLVYEERGGHGPIEGLYAQTERAWTQLRAGVGSKAVRRESRCTCPMSLRERGTHGVGCPLNREPVES